MKSRTDEDTGMSISVGIPRAARCRGTASLSGRMLRCLP